MFLLRFKVRLGLKVFYNFLWFQVIMFFRYVFRCPSLSNSLSSFTIYKDKEETLLPFAFREILCYSWGRKCVFFKQSKFAYFIKVNISDVFARTPRGTVSRAMVCLLEVLLPAASRESEAFDATCWLRMSVPRLYSFPGECINISFTVLANHVLKIKLQHVFYPNS